jgi:hypothetical protein
MVFIVENNVDSKINVILVVMIARFILGISYDNIYIREIWIIVV